MNQSSATLAALKAALDQAGRGRDAAQAACDAAPQSDEVHSVFDGAISRFWGIIDQIAAVTPSSLADLRVKAYALDWAARLTDDEPYHSPSDGETLILKQLVAGLLDERIA